MELTFGDRALAEKARGDVVFSAHLIGERKTDGERQPAADNGVAPIEIGRGIEHMH